MRSYITKLRNLMLTWILIFQTETLDFIFWFRQTIGLVAGLAAGMLQLEGMFVIIGFFILMFAISNIYAYKMLNVSDDDFPNNELMMEGFGNSTGIFFVSYMTSISTLKFHGQFQLFCALFVCLIYVCSYSCHGYCASPSCEHLFKRPFISTIILVALDHELNTPL